MRVPRISLANLLNVLQSPIGRMASWPMRNIKTFPSKQMYLYLSLIKGKEAEFYHDIDRKRSLVWFKWLVFIAFLGQFMVSLFIWVHFSSLEFDLKPSESFHIFSFRSFCHWQMRLDRMVIMAMIHKYHCCYAEIMSLYYVKSILTEISASRQDKMVLQKSKVIRIKFLSIWSMLQTSRYV